MFTRLAFALGVSLSALIASAPWTFLSRSGPSTVRFTAPVAVAADFDGDGVPDPAVLRGTVAEVTLSKRHTTIALPTLPHTTALAAADIDHDGDIDLVSMADAGVRGWTNRQSGAFTEWTIGPPTPRPLDHLDAVRWTAATPFLPAAVSSRSRTEVVIDRLEIPAPRLNPQPSLAIDGGRAPPRLIAFERPSRAPPAIFIS